MVDRVGDYVFVTGENPNEDCPLGDLGRIHINGGIMPLRDEEPDPTNALNAKRVLRGEDMAFLGEAIAERFAWWDTATANDGITTQVTNQWSGAEAVFSRRLTRFDNLATPRFQCNPSALLSRIMRMALSASDQPQTFYLENAPRTGMASVKNTGQASAKWGLVRQYFSPISSFDVPDAIGTKFIREDIERLFDAVKIINYGAEAFEFDIAHPLSSRIDYQRSGDADVPDYPATRNSIGFYSSSQRFHPERQGEPDKTIVQSAYYERTGGDSPLALTFGQIEPASVALYALITWEHIAVDATRNVWDEYFTLCDLSTVPGPKSLVSAAASSCGVTLAAPPVPEDYSAEYVNRFYASNCRIFAVARFGDHTRWQT